MANKTSMNRLNSQKVKFRDILAVTKEITAMESICILKSVLKLRILT